MLYAFVRLFPLILLLFVGGCIQSSHDIALDLPIELPKLEGIFVQSGGNGVVIIKPAIGGYMTQWGEQEPYFMRLFKIPDYSGYVVQLYGASFDSSNHHRPMFAYLFVQIFSDELSVKGFSLAKLDFGHLPANFKARVNVSSDQYYVEPKDPGQTLEIIREGAKLLAPPTEYRRSNSPPP